MTEYIILSFVIIFETITILTLLNNCDILVKENYRLFKEVIKKNIEKSANN